LVVQALKSFNPPLFIRGIPALKYTDEPRRSSGS
jgi:hypothetical protein